jgi:hypothetical protein
MSMRVRIFTIDGDFTKIASTIGLHYPSTAPAPCDGCVIEIERGPIGFFGRAGDDDAGLLVGVCTGPRERWLVRRIEDFWEQDLYLRDIQRCRSMAQSGTEFLNETKRLLEDLTAGTLRRRTTRGVGATGEIPEFSEDLLWVVDDHELMVELTYEHDVHDHSYGPALATVGVTCFLELATGVLTAGDAAEHDPPMLSQQHKRKMQPGDHVRVGKNVCRRLTDHINRQGSANPMVFPCLRRFSSD